LLLSIAGIYGTLSYSVARRTSEIGIRSALGAGRGSILALVIGQGLRPVLFGIAIGLIAALGLSHLLAGMVFGVSVNDPATYIVVAGIAIAVAVVSCYIPARRALSVDAVTALRYE
ncbi:MAG TPA: FtsX-like permease family protein, partial [Blastocatellia bacterium]